SQTRYCTPHSRLPYCQSNSRAPASESVLLHSRIGFVLVPIDTSCPPCIVESVSPTIPTSSPDSRSDEWCVDSHTQFFLLVYPQKPSPTLHRPTRYSTPGVLSVSQNKRSTVETNRKAHGNLAEWRRIVGGIRTTA